MKESHKGLKLTDSQRFLDYGWWPQQGSQTYFWSEHTQEDCKLFLTAVGCGVKANFFKLGGKTFTTLLKKKLPTGLLA